VTDPGPFGTGALSTLDRDVIAAISHPRRFRDVAGMVNARRRLYARPEVPEADVRGVLRGLEHLGKASGRGGWWRAL